MDDTGRVEIVISGYDGQILVATQGFQGLFRQLKFPPEREIGQIPCDDGVVHLLPDDFIHGSHAHRGRMRPFSHDHQVGQPEDTSIEEPVGLQRPRREKMQIGEVSNSHGGE